MVDFELNLRQKKLVQQLAELKKSDQLIEPMNLFPAGLMNYIVYLRSRYNLRIQVVSDLEVLCFAGYLTYEWNRSGLAKLYRVADRALEVLDDETFITEEDYKIDDESVPAPELFADSTESPPIDESLQSLLFADFKRLTQLLTKKCGQIFDKDAAEEIKSKIGETINCLDSSMRIESQVIKGVDAIGRSLQQALSQEIGSPNGREITHTMTIFGLWASKINDELQQ